MRTMADGSIPVRELDLYEKTDGNPTIPDRIEQAAADSDTTSEPGETGAEPETSSGTAGPPVTRQEWIEFGFPLALYDLLWPNALD